MEKPRMYIYIYVYCVCTCRSVSCEYYPAESGKITKLELGGLALCPKSWLAANGHTMQNRSVICSMILYMFMYSITLHTHVC